MPQAVLMTVGGIAYARLLKESTLHIAVGEGDPAWDVATTIPQPAATATTLTAELARVVATSQYLDAIGSVSVPPTNYLNCSGQFGIGVANGFIREVGLFAFGTGAADSGILIAAARFAAVEKPAGVDDFVLSRVIRVRYLE